MCFLFYVDDAEVQEDRFVIGTETQGALILSNCLADPVRAGIQNSEISDGANVVSLLFQDRLKALFGGPIITGRQGLDGMIESDLCRFRLCMGKQAAKKQACGNLHIGK